MPDGTQRQTSFKEARKMFAAFPIKDTCEPPAEEAKSFPNLDSESEAFDANPDRPLA